MALMACKTSGQRGWLPARSAARAFQPSMSSLRSLSLVTFAYQASGWLAGTVPILVDACLAIAPQAQLRSSLVSCMPHLSIMPAAPSASVVASLMSASRMISFLTFVIAICLVARKRNGLALSSATRPSDSGETMFTASRAARGRFASMASLALSHTSVGPRCWVPTSRAAAVVQPSSASRWANQLFLTSSAMRGPDEGPVLRFSINSA